MASAKSTKMKDEKNLKHEERSRIIASLYQNKVIGRWIKRAARGKEETFEDEIRSNVFLYICEMDIDKLLGLDAMNELIPYIIFKVKSRRTDFNASSVNKQINYIPNRVDNEFLEGQYSMDIIKDESAWSVDDLDIEAAMDKLNWFEKRVVELYVGYGSIKDVVEHTGTDKSYVVKVLNASRKKIKDALR